MAVGQKPAMGETITIIEEEEEEAVTTTIAMIMLPMPASPPTTHLRTPPSSRP